MQYSKRIQYQTSPQHSVLTGVLSAVQQLSLRNCADSETRYGYQKWPARWPQKTTDLVSWSHLPALCTSFAPSRFTKWTKWSKWILFWCRRRTDMERRFVTPARTSKPALSVVRGPQLNVVGLRRTWTSQGSSGRQSPFDGAHFPYYCIYIISVAGVFAFLPFLCS